MKKIIGKNVEIVGNCNIGKNVKLKNCVLEDCVVGDNCEVENAHIFQSKVGAHCKIGPYVNLRKDCILEDNVKIGSFVEIKNSIVGSGTKVPHFAYIGDAKIGKNVNVGCGVVFANYNGKEKQMSIIGDNVFIGANVNIVAPVNIADGTYICAGTTVTKSTERGDFVIGRVRQENKKR